MGPHLTYRPREGIVFGVVAGRSIRLATQRHQGGMDMWAWHEAARNARVTPWDKVQEIRSGQVSPGRPGQRLTVAESAPLEIYDYPGDYAQRFDGVDKGGGSSNHRHHARVVWVKLRTGGGFPIHGPPACGSAGCIVIAQEWDSLFNALKATRQVSIVVEL